MSKVKKIATLSMGKGINVIVNFLFLPYMARVLDYDAYGTYSQAILIGTFTTALFSIGLSQIIYVYLSKTDQKKEVLFSNVSAGLFSGFVGSLLLFLLADFFANWLDNSLLTIPLRYYSAAIVFIIPFASLNANLIYNNKVKQSVFISIVSNLIKIILVVYFIQVYASVNLALLAIVISYFIQLLLGYLFTRNELRFSFSNKLFKEQIVKGLPLGLTGILGSGILYMDGLMVSKMQGVQAFAIYRNGAIELPFIATIYSSIAAIVLPEVAKLFSKHKFFEIVELKKKVIMNTMMLTYPILVFVLFNAKNIVVLYLGQKYEASALIFAVFNLSLLIRINDYHDVLIAANKVKLLFNYYLAVFILNIILNYILISYFGILGAAIATVLSLFIFAFVLLKRSLKLIGAKIMDVFDFMDVFKLLGTAILISIILHFVTIGLTSKFLSLLISSLIYFPIIYYYLYRSNLISSVVVNKFLNKIFRRKV